MNISLCRICFVHFWEVLYKFEMSRHRFRSDILWIIIWLIISALRWTFLIGNWLIGHWQPGWPSFPIWPGVVWRWISAWCYMRQASLGQAKFWRKGFNMEPKPLYLGSISDTILDTSIVFCFCFCCWCWQWYTSYPMSSSPSLLSAFPKLFILTQTRLAWLLYYYDFDLEMITK